MNQTTLHTWNEIPSDCPMKFLERRRVVGTNTMISNVTLYPGCDVPSHAHENEQMSCVIQGCVIFTVVQPDGTKQEIRIGEGQVLHLPSLFSHGATLETLSIVLDVFSPPSATTGIDQNNRS